MRFERGIFVFAFLLVLTVIVSASTTTENFYPTSGEDHTGNITYVMTSTDLDKVEVSDDSRYEIYGAWNFNNLDNPDYVEWSFSPNINSEADIEDVKLTFEWQRGSYIHSIAEIRVFVGDEEIYGTIIANLIQGDDVVEVRNLPIDTPEELNELKIRFYAADPTGTGTPSWKTKHDLVELEVDYFLDIDAPVCSVDYLEGKYSDNEYEFENLIYVGEDGYFYVFGNSEDEDSNIINVQYNRTSPDDYHAWSGADAVDGAFNEMQEEWKSDKDDKDYIDGWHTICCRATDSENNVGEGTCQEFCIDTQDPNKVTGVINSDPSECVSNYVSDKIVFSWNAADSNGCAPIKKYVIRLYTDDNHLIGEYEETGTEFIVPQDELVNGEYYYIEVLAVDEAGNEGERSDASEHVYFDNEKPEIEIWGSEGWLKDDFTFYENDTDNLGLYECEYKIGDGEWTPTNCGLEESLGVQVPEDCFESGENTCIVSKRVKDNACNIQESREGFDIDVTLPQTTKTITGPQYLGKLFEWLGIDYALDLFIRDDTIISFSCYDGHSGCSATYYRYKFNDGEWTNFTEFDEGYPIMFEEDGVYTLEYYSVDGVGNEEDPIIEIDKVDTEAPETIKTISGPQYYDEENERLWVNAETEFTLSCTDSEVGCDLTYYSIDDGDEQSSNDTITFTLGELDDEEHNIYFWSKDLLGNLENENNKTDWLDTHFPIITVHNPTDEETHVERCEQAIFVEAYEIQSVVGSGVNESSVRAELWNSNDVMVAETPLRKEGNFTYSARMDKEFPAGEYLLKIYAKDNVENEFMISINETLEDAIFVEYVSPASCNVNVEQGGSCDFNFNICMRGGNNINMWMNKISGLVIPSDLEAEISNGEESTFVGLKHSEPKDYDECISAQSQAGFYSWEEGACYWQENKELLPLTICDEEINGRTNFNLRLEFDSTDAQSIGPGSHELEYWIESSLVECGDEEIPEDNETNQTEPEPTEGHVVINEFMANPLVGNDWVEIYNNGESSFDLGECYLKDGSDGGNRLNLSGSIEGGEFAVFYWSNRLSQEEDAINLYCQDLLIDSVSYGNFDDGNITDNVDPEPVNGESAGRFPDGQDTGVDNIDFVIFSYPTQGYENEISV